MQIEITADEAYVLAVMRIDQTHGDAVHNYAKTLTDEERVQGLDGAYTAD